MKTVELLSALRRANVVLTVAGDRLRVQAPNGALTPELRAQLAERKDELLAFLQGTQSAALNAPPPITLAPRDGALPLSFAQERLWFLDQLEPGTAAYNIPGGLHLRGALDAAALGQALNEIIRRHEALRTSFKTADGKPTQIVSETREFDFPLTDLSSLSPDERAGAVEAVARAEAQQGFDLTCAPLFRARLVKLSAQEHVLLFTMHHIISDGWSMGVLARELGALYASFARGQSPQLPGLPVQYADFAVWQRQWLQGEVYREQLSYWQRQLNGAPPVLDLPTDFTRPQEQSYRGAAHSFLIPPPIAEALQAISQREDATLFMTLLAAFQTLLFRYTAQADIVIGSPVANRQQLETELLIGFFVNTLVLRTELGGDPAFSQLLRRSREACLGAYAHQDFPFERLVEELRPERSLSHTPLFQVMFELQTAPLGKLSLLNLERQSWPSKVRTAKFDLSLTIRATPGELRGEFEYAADLFMPATIERMAAHFQSGLAAIAVNPDQRLSTLSLLSTEERQTLLHDWNQTAIASPKQQRAYQLFEAQAERTPDAIALIASGEKLNYAELNTRANQWARRLRGLGVGPESVVGICLERSVEMVVAVLAVHKAGGAYLPLDPQHPRERLAFMIEDCGCSLVLTQQRLAESLASTGIRQLRIDTDWPQAAYENTENLPGVAEAEHLAYVIYTSGSTGKPKGVMIDHRALTNYAAAVIVGYGVKREDRVLQFAALSFDASVMEIFQTLCCGATLVLRSEEMIATPSAFWRACRDWQLTVVELPTAFWRELAMGSSADELAQTISLRTVIIGGEQATREAVAAWMKIAPAQMRLINSYGPTETTVDAAIGELRADEFNPLREVPIGRPVANSQLYVLDQWLQPAPVGVPGELYVGGAGLARGYLNRPALTAERFLPDPFSAEAGARLYRTGDKARFRANGQVECLGRFDQQIKLRGFRIELGEIEAALAQHPAVRDVAVAAPETEPGRRHLVAYVAAQASAVTPGELRAFLQSKLPEYMTPAVFVVMEALPRTPGGKVDRHALPVPEATPAEEHFAAPRTPAEQTLARIWQQVLGIARVGIRDNFFALGGDSILSIQIIAKANQAGLHFTPKQLFQHQTIAALVAVAGTTSAINAEQGLVRGEAPLTPIQQWFFEQSFAQPQHWNQALLLELRQDVEAAPLQLAFNKLLAHHDALRLRFKQVGQAWHQSFVEFDEAAAEITTIDLSPLPPEARGQALTRAAEAAQASLNLTDGPLVRALRFTRGADEPGRLLLVIHHLLVDGVSWRILLEDLAQAYEQARAKLPIKLPAKTTSFQQWAAALADYAQSGEVRQQAGYWLGVASAQIAPLPVESHGANTEASAEQVTVTLSVEETSALLQEVPAAFHSEINDALLMALAQCLTQGGGNRAVRIDLEGHGREEIARHLDVSRTVGWFTTVYPVVLTISGTGDPGRDLKMVKEQLRAVPGRGIGYGLLRYLPQYLDDESSAAELRAQPAAEIAFNYLGQLDHALPADSILRPAQEKSGHWQSPDARRNHLLEINASVSRGQLRVTWNYSRNIHQRATIERLAQCYLAALRALLAHCRGAQGAGFTPSDFPLAKLDQRQLDKLLAKVSRASGKGAR